MTGERKQVALEILSRIEHREAELLGWGVVDGAFDHDELFDLVDELLDAHDPDDVFGGDPDAVPSLAQLRFWDRAATSPSALVAASSSSAAVTAARSSRAHSGTASRW